MTPIAEIVEAILADPFADVTFTGGDPMMQAEGFAELARAIHQTSRKTIWCYTGYSYEACLANPQRSALLREIDVLVDGPFIEDLRDTSLHFRGSSNQRLVDVKTSLENGEVVLYREE